MSKKLFLGTLAMAVALPVIVAPVQAQEVETEVSTDLKDVLKSNSAYKEIMAMYDQGIIDAYPGNMFKPAQSISRVHVAYSFVQALDLQPIRAGKEFKDVPKTHQYYDIVQKVYRAGIFDGKTDGTFGVSDNLTRAQMAKVMVEAFDLDIHKGYIFDDVAASHWAKDYISSIYMSGITVGSNGKYMPSDPVSRAHYATFLYRALNPELAPKPDKPLKPTPPAVKPEPKPETPKPKPPVVRVERVVEPEYESPKPEYTPNNPFPNPSDVKKPSGWTEDIMKEHDEKIKDVVFKYAPKVGTGSQFGKSRMGTQEFNDPATTSLIASQLKAINSSVTVNEWIAAVNQVIKTGDVYIAPDYSFGVYVKYHDNATDITVIW